jgi:hypothetical protein
VSIEDRDWYQARRTILCHDEEGPAGITHQRVAERAGAGRATVYRHLAQPADRRLLPSRR